MSENLHDERAAHGANGYWKVVFALMLIYAYAFADRVILALLAEPVRESLHVSDVQMSLLLGLAFSFIYCACNLPSGYLADKVNRRILLAFASVFWALMTVLCGTSTSYTQLFIARAGVGIAEGVISPTAFSLIRDTVPLRSRPLAFSIYGMAPMIGGAASLMGGGYVLKAAESGAFAQVPFFSTLEPWQCAMLTVGLLGLPLSLVLFTFREPLRLLEAGQEKQPLVAAMATAWRYIIRNGSLYGPLLTFSACGAMMNFASSAWLPTAVSRQWHLVPHDVGPRLGLMTLIGGIIGLSIGGHIMNRIARRGGSTLSFGAFAVICTALGIAAGVFAPTLPIAYAGLQFAMLFTGISFSAAAATLSEITPVNLTGRISAIYLMVQTVIGQTVGPFAVATVSQSILNGPESIPVALVITMSTCAMACFIAAIVMARNRRRARRISPAAAALSEHNLEAATQTPSPLER